MARTHKTAAFVSSRMVCQSCKDVKQLIVFAASVRSVSPETKCQTDRQPNAIIPTIGVLNVFALLVLPAEHNETSRTVLYAGKIKRYSYGMVRQREYGTAHY